MNPYDFRDRNYVASRRRHHPPVVQFSLRTMFAISLICIAVVSIYRMDLVSAIMGISLLFTVFMFAEDIWPKLPR
jgi:hypothetical protein